MVRQYSQPWEKDKSKLLQKLRGDYEGMRRQLSIALKKIEMMAAEVLRPELGIYQLLYDMIITDDYCKLPDTLYMQEERIKHERRVMNWERLYAQVMVR